MSDRILLSTSFKHIIQLPAESNEDSIKAFNSDLHNELKICINSETNTILEDFNTKVGHQHDGYAVAKY